MDSGPQEIEWLVRGLIPRCGLVMLAARPKVSKSLLSLNLAIGLRRGSFLGRECECAKTLIIQLEDMPPLVRERIAKMGLERNIFVRAGIRAIDLRTLPKFIKFHNIDLVVIDPMIFATGGIDENDAAKMGNFFQSLRQIVFETNCTILLIHHLRKSQGDNGDAIRGSSAILGAVDVALELRRENENTPRATLLMISRYGNMEPETLTLVDETLTWHSEGNAHDYKQTKREREILKALADCGQEMDCPALESALGIKAPNFMPALKQLIAKSLVTQRKESTLGRPRSYFLLPSAINQAES